MNSPLTLEGEAFNGAMPISILVLLRSLNLALAMSKADRLTAALLSRLIFFLRSNVSDGRRYLVADLFVGAVFVNFTENGVPFLCGQLAAVQVAIKFIFTPK